MSRARELANLGNNASGLETFTSDITDVKNDIATIALNQASDHSKIYYNLNDQIIDTFTDATGISSSSSNLISGSYSPLGLSFRYLRVYITNADYHDSNAGSSVINFFDQIADGTHTGTTTTTGGGGGTSSTNIIISSATSSIWYTSNQSNTQYGTVDFGSEKTSITKLYIGKHRTNGDPRRMRLAYSSNGTDFYDVLIASSGMTYNASQGNTSFDFSRYDDNEVNLTAFSTNSQQGYSSIEGGDNWVRDTMTLESNSFTASSAPTKGDLIIMMEDHAGTATINTDIKGYISRDGGTTFTQGTLVEGGSWGTNKKTLAFHDLDISSQPSGTSIKYKIELANQATSKIQKIHGVSLGWK